MTEVTRLKILDASVKASNATPEQAKKHQETVYGRARSWEEEAHDAWSRVSKAVKYVEAFIKDEPQRSELLSILRTGA